MRIVNGELWMVNCERDCLSLTAAYQTIGLLKYDQTYFPKI